jgi:hypothetical protein
MIAHTLYHHFVTKLCIQLQKHVFVMFYDFFPTHGVQGQWQWQWHGKHIEIGVWSPVGIMSLKSIYNIPQCTVLKVNIRSEVLKIKHSASSSSLNTMSFSNKSPAFMYQSDNLRGKPGISHGSLAE